jgi:hypothetical protein
MLYQPKKESTKYGCSANSLSKKRLNDLSGKKKAYWRFCAHKNMNAHTNNHVQFHASHEASRVDRSPTSIARVKNCWNWNWSYWHNAHSASALKKDIPVMDSSVHTSSLIVRLLFSLHGHRSIESQINSTNILKSFWNRCLPQHYCFEGWKCL